MVNAQLSNLISLHCNYWQWSDSPVGLAVVPVKNTIISTRFSTKGDFPWVISGWWGALIINSQIYLKLNLILMHFFLGHNLLF